MARRQLVYKGTRVTAWYEPDRRSIARCAVGPELTRELHGILADVAKPYAIGISPRRTGHYAKSFKVDMTYVAMGVPLMTRVAGRLVNTDRAAAAIEYGVKNRKTRFGGPAKAQAGAHVLGRTLSMLIGAGLVRAPGLPDLP